VTPGRRIAVRAHPGASRERLEWRGEVLHVWVNAPATGSAANRALVRAVAESLRLRASAVRLVAGERARDKVLEVDDRRGNPTHPTKSSISRGPRGSPGGGSPGSGTHRAGRSRAFSLAPVPPLQGAPFETLQVDDAP